MLLHDDALSEAEGHDGVNFSFTEKLLNTASAPDPVPINGCAAPAAVIVSVNIPTPSDVVHTA